MLKKKLFKNVSAVLISLALVAPLALNSSYANADSQPQNTASQPANQDASYYQSDLVNNKAMVKKYQSRIKYDKKMLHRINVSHKRANHHLMKIAKHYFHNYEKNGLKKTASLRKGHSHLYKKAIMQAYNGDINKKLARNPQYKEGYLHYLVNPTLGNLSRDNAHKLYKFGLQNGNIGTPDEMAKAVSLAKQGVIK